MSEETGGKKSPTARRLRAVRQSEGFAVAKLFAAHLGIEPTRLSNMENGKPLSLDVALKIKARTGVSLDWLYHEDEAGLSVAVRDRLRAQLAAEDEKGKTTRSRSRSKVSGA